MEISAIYLKEKFLGGILLKSDLNRLGDASINLYEERIKCLSSWISAYFDRSVRESLRQSRRLVSWARRREVFMDAFAGKYSLGSACSHCGGQAIGSHSAHVCVKCGTAEVAGAGLSVLLAVGAIGGGCLW